MKLINKLKTNLSITGKYLVTLITIVIIELILNLFIYFEVFTYSRTMNYFSPESFTLKFFNYIHVKNNIPYLKDDGKKELSNNAAWIQIVDENLKEVYSFNKPIDVPITYTPVNFIHIHKYDIANSTVFISEKTYEGKSFSYIIGFPIETVAKHTLTFNPSAIKDFAFNGFIILIVINILAAVVLAYFLFGKRLGKPLENIINGINDLSEGNYDVKFKESGIYKNVFHNLNKLSEALNENLKKRAELDNMRDTWISSISHDIKTPLSSIKGYSEIMNDSSYSFSEEEILDYSSIIYNKSMYIESLINDLNLTYKLKNKVFSLTKSQVNLVKLLQNIIIEILNHPLYSKVNINFYSLLENIIYDVDETLFKRALTNLIFNSIIHNNEDVVIYVSIYQKDKLYIVIKDNGKGISKKDQYHIFERYYRGTNTSSSKEGSGLGMAIAKQIIDIHNGKICIESELGIGTTLTISL